jgi:soluble cytochrome b562
MNGGIGMDIEKFIEKYKKKVSLREQDIKDFRESNNPELLNAIPIYERENAEFKTIIEALDKQIPKNPIENSYDESSEDDYDEGYLYNCPCCDNNVGKYSKEAEEWVWKVNYCPECGQKIQWS